MTPRVLVVSDREQRVLRGLELLRRDPKMRRYVHHAKTLLALRKANRILAASRPGRAT